MRSLPNTARHTIARRGENGKDPAGRGPDLDHARPRGPGEPSAGHASDYHGRLEPAGDIAVDSVPGDGTAFTVYLPLATLAMAEPLLRPAGSAQERDQTRE
jgi:hypothetical protein